VWLLLLVCGWLAGTVSGVAGFGGALLLLPVLSMAVGVKEAVPVLTVAQLLGNASRAAFGWGEIRWRPALLFSAGAVGAGVAGARLFVGLPAGLVLRSVGVLLIAVVGLRHTRLGRWTTPEWALAPAGAAVGFLSAVAGSAGPLGAAVFLGLRLPPAAYVASEAVTAVSVHLTKTIVYGRYAALGPADLARGLVLGGTLVLGAWTGKALIGRIPESRFALLVEALLALSGALLLVPH
jgi:uncharacterized membrane protein YfcA